MEVGEGRQPESAKNLHWITAALLQPRWQDGHGSQRPLAAISTVTISDNSPERHRLKHQAGLRTMSQLLSTSEQILATEQRTERSRLQSPQVVVNEPMPPWQRGQMAPGPSRALLAPSPLSPSTAALGIPPVLFRPPSSVVNGGVDAPEGCHPQLRAGDPPVLYTLP